jgi:histidinol-phosphate aminotransferase
MHWIYSLTNNCKIIKVGYSSEFIFDFEKLLSSVNEETTCVCISNPVSPIGNIISLDDIEKLLKKADRLDIPVLVDEAYIEFSDQKSCLCLIKNNPNLVVSRTFSKALGAAGMRIGFLTGNTELINIIKKISNPYEVSSLAIKFGINLLDNYHVVHDYVLKIKEERKIIENILLKNNIDHVKSETNTMHIKINKRGIDTYLEKNNIYCKTKKINNDTYMCFSLYPGFSKSEFFYYLTND